jgi:CheY-like chemotaxis protein
LHNVFERIPPVARILIVDDSEDIRMALTDALESDGHTISTAEDGANALAILLNQPQDLVLTDMQMPCITGPALIAQMKHLYPHIPIIGMTAGLHPSQVEEERQRLDIPAFFSKPLAIADLCRAVQQLTTHTSGTPSAT